ncbi:DUF1214 domain-containing protein [Mesorhizobium loti]|nr:DUF1214 domain-containing protein [Mesorhizobium loti]PLP59699.1 DUF1214 domain-containing protein [Mesorhizobium loti]
MLKNALLTLLALTIAIGLGGGSVWYTLDAQSGGGAIRIGPWTAFPDIGTLDADPYSQARVARQGALTLGRAEGLSFVADADSSGEGLRRECSYTIEGGFPTARFWTLHVADLALESIASGRPHQAALHSYEILRQSDNSAVITVAPNAAAGNWLPVNGSGPLRFMLNFYDTPIAASTGLSDVKLPAIVKSGCNG